MDNMMTSIVRLLSRDEVFSNNGDDIEQRAQFTLLGKKSIFELFYHTGMQRTILECHHTDSIVWTDLQERYHRMKGLEYAMFPKGFYMIDIENATINDILKIIIYHATSGTATDISTIELHEPYKHTIDADMYLKMTVKEAPPSQFIIHGASYQ